MDKFKKVYKCLINMVQHYITQLILDVAKNIKDPILAEIITTKFTTSKKILDNSQFNVATPSKCSKEVAMLLSEIVEDENYNKKVANLIEKIPDKVCKNEEMEIDFEYEKFKSEIYKNFPGEKLPGEKKINEILGQDFTLYKIRKFKKMMIDETLK